jgi:hypothetical protein
MAYPPIDEIIDAALANNDHATEIRLGVNPMRDFRQWARPFMATSASPGAPNEYDGIPVVEVQTNDNRRAYVNQRGELVILD